METGIASVPVRKYSRAKPGAVEGATEGQVILFDDKVAIEEPLEIRLDFEDGGRRTQKSISMTMRTPGSDFELAAGFLLTEGVIGASNDIVNITYCGKVVPYLGHSNTVKVELASHVELKMKSLERNFYTTSSCGVCGKASVDALKTQNQFTRDLSSGLVKSEFPIDIVSELPDRLRTAQKVFDSTGGLHASGLFTATGELISAKEDVGRHNALDKIIGEALLQNRLPLTNAILMLSGRISFELVQKAAMAGLTMVVAVGAPSSLALELAKQMKMTLIGFAREDRFNVYCGEERLQ